MVVGDLFGGGQNSVYKALQEDNGYDIYTFDVTEPTREKHFKVDLSQDNIVEVMSKYPKPDIIVPSPLCQSFSCVLNMKGGGTCFGKLNEDKTMLIERSVEEFERLKNGFTKHLDADTQLFIKRLGQKCIDNTIELIKHYKPKYGYIENPKSSLMGKYITLNRTDFYNKDTGFLNQRSYGKYGYLTNKPTTFLSNVKMELLTGKTPPPYTIEIIDGEKYYVLKDDVSVKVKHDLNSRMIGLSSINKMIKARRVNSGVGGMDFIIRNSKQTKQKDRKTNEQLSEAGAVSSIPSELIKHIFSFFKE